MMKKYQAEWVYPVTSAPVYQGVVIADDGGRIEAVVRNGEAGEDVQQLRGIICPGFINAHVHLELSWMKQLIGQGIGLDNFIGAIEQSKVESQPEAVAAAIQQAGDEMALTGTVGYGDICNTPDTLLFKQASGLMAHNFIEVFGSHPAKAESAFKSARRLYKVFKALLPKGTSSIVPHATYSLSSDLFKTIQQFAELEQSLMSIHHAESAAEIDLFLKMDGPIYKRLQQWGIPKTYLPFNDQRPIATLKALLPTQSRMMFVHNTFIQDSDFDVIANNFSDAWFTLCPRSNYYIERMLPPFGLIAEHSNRILLGTDSLASVNSLNMAEEIQFVLNASPDISLAQILQWATLNGARFFGWDALLGSLDVGKTPGLVNVIGLERSGQSPLEVKVL
jgi:cytosine/adenosine deaminase-related metal-dependent hydrolase